MPGRLRGAGDWNWAFADRRNLHTVVSCCAVRGVPGIFRGQGRAAKIRRDADLPIAGPGNSVASVLTFPPGNSDHRRDAALDIVIRGGPAGHADAHCRMPVPLRSSAPAGPITLHARDDSPGFLLAAER